MSLLSRARAELLLPEVMAAEPAEGRRRTAAHGSRESGGAVSDASLQVILGTLAVGILIVTVYQSPGFWGANDLSRWATVYSLVEQGTYRIDGAPWQQQIDVVRLNGHFYSSKPPVLPTLLAGEYWLLKVLSGGRLSFAAHPLWTAKAMLLLTNLLPFVLFLWLYARLVNRLTAHRWVRLVTIAAAAGGTFLSGFLTTLSNHTLAAFCLFFALYVSGGILSEGRRSRWRFAVAGLCASLAGVIELPALLVLPPLAAVLFWKARGRALGWFLPAALLPLALHIWCNYQIAGSWVPVYANKPAYLFAGATWRLGPEGRLVGPPGTIDALWEPWWVYMFHNVVGHHGFFTLSPIMLLALVGLTRVAAGYRAADRWLRATAILTAVLSVALLVLYTFCTGHRNYGGRTAGPRYFFWLIPLWLVFLPAGLEWLAHKRVGRGAALACLLVSVVSAFYAASCPWRPPWVHHLFRAAGVVDY